MRNENYSYRVIPKLAGTLFALIVQTEFSPVVVPNVKITCSYLTMLMYLAMPICFDRGHIFGHGHIYYLAKPIYAHVFDRAHISSYDHIFGHVYVFGHVCPQGWRSET